jgi:hypothetical protein
MYAHITPTHEKEVSLLIQRLQNEFPAKGKPVTVRKDDPFLWLNFYGKFDKEQVKWLDKCKQIDDWSWGIGGMMTLHNQTVTVDTFPSEWEIKTGNRTAKFDIFPSETVGKYLDIDGGPAKKFVTDVELHAYLEAFNIPLVGWTQRITLCERCDGPGAGLGYSKCPDCEAALIAFMAAPTHAWCDEVFGEEVAS